MRNFVILSLLSFILTTNAAHAQTRSACSLLLDNSKIAGELQSYELIRDLTLQPTKDLANFAPRQGLFVTKRDDQGHPIEGFIRVLSDNPGNVIEVVGDFNGWGSHDPVRLQPDPADSRYVVGTLLNISHAMQYRLVLNGQQVLDPAALLQSSAGFNANMGRSGDYLNSVFWDVEGVARYDFKNKPVQLGVKGGVAISENDIVALTQKWPYNGRLGPADPKDTFKFILESGLIDKLKSEGYSAVEFLPLTTSVDGDTWAYRYLDYAPFSLDSRWGTPQEFARMADAFRGAGMAVILDLVPGHYPHSGNSGDRSLGPLGIHNFKKADGQALYGDLGTVWGTTRYDYQNPYVRTYLRDAILNMVKYYGIDGIRIDNFVGILGIPGGSQFSHELLAEIRAYAPTLYINVESFGGDNSITGRIDNGGYGASVHNAGDFFHNFIKPMAQKRTEELDLSIVQNLIHNIWNWRENAVVNYITDHDESANNGGDASGSYFATLVNGGGWNYVEGKTRAFAGLAMLSGSFYLDMIQLRFLQEGSFYSNTNVDYSLEQYNSQRNMDLFFSDMTKYYTTQAAFAFHNLHSQIENHTDHDNKIMSLKRVDSQTGKVIYALINLGDRAIENYRFGVSESGLFHVAIDSDLAKYGGQNRMANSIHGEALHTDEQGAHAKAHSLNVPYVAPYSVTIFESL